MAALRRMRTRPSGDVAHGIDRMIGNIETGRFERSLSALMAAGSVVTAAEIFFEHDSASSGNRCVGPGRPRPGWRRGGNRRVL